MFDEKEICEGENATFSCLGSGAIFWQYTQAADPNPVFLGGGSSVFIESDDAKYYRLSATPERSTLYVRNVTMNMNGTVYTCVLQREIYCSRLIVKGQ